MDTMKKSAVLAAAAIVLSAIFAVLAAGCKSSSEPVNSSPVVRMAVSFSKAGSAGLMKQAAALGADSLRIDSVVVVFSRIKFLLPSDSVTVDTAHAENDWLDRDSSVVFRGPFVVHVHDTVGIDLGSQTLPAGAYDGIVFKVHRLGFGEHHWDSDEHSSHETWADSGLAGSSLTVWGAVFKNAAWTPFTYLLNDELEFKVRGNFVIPDATSSINIALNINTGVWFRNPSDGSLLDPTDSTSMNQELIRESIAKAFDDCRGGHDRGDGRP
jgi:hypothetical protein